MLYFLTYVSGPSMSTWWSFAKFGLINATVEISFNIWHSWLENAYSYPNT